MRELMDEVAEKRSLKPKIVFETNLFSLVRTLIKERLGISTFLRMVVSVITSYSIHYTKLYEVPFLTCSFWEKALVYFVIPLVYC